MTRFILILAITFPAFATAACRKGGSAGTSTTAHVPGTPHTDEALNAWRNAGLAPEGFAAIQPVPYDAVYCEQGRVRGVDTTVCEYTDDVTLDRGVQQVKAGWARVDTHTGVVLRAKHTLMIAVDRERREPSGKTISQMAKIFGKL